MYGHFVVKCIRCRIHPICVIQDTAYIEEKKTEVRRYKCPWCSEVYEALIKGEDDCLYWSIGKEPGENIN